MNDNCEVQFQNRCHIDYQMSEWNDYTVLLDSRLVKGFVDGMSQRQVPSDVIESKMKSRVKTLVISPWKRWINTNKYQTYRRNRNFGEVGCY